MKNSLIKEKVIFFGNCPPKKCGIATFTSHLSGMMRRLFSKSVSFYLVPTIEKKSEIAKKDIYSFIHKERVEDYIKLAEKINADPTVRVVNVQHEYGIFGGERGVYLLEFLKRVERPVFLSMHSVLPTPEKSFLEVTKQLAHYCQRLIVMNNFSKNILRKDYRIAKEKIVVIPHGVHSFPFSLAPQKRKEKNLLTFGFLSPNKGIEYFLEALALVKKENPHFIYKVVGVTHPKLKEYEGEKYRNFLKAEVRRLGLQNNVVFKNKFQTDKEIIRELKGCDIYLSTSLDPRQAVSGTFSYALSAGRPVVSTEFIQTQEMLKEDRGILVKARDPQATKEAILRLLNDAPLRQAMSSTNYTLSRAMTWENVALTYMSYFSRHLEPDSVHINFPEWSLEHLDRMTDDAGMIQFALFHVPDKSSGYTVDDNARAMLVVSSLLKKHHVRKRALRLMYIYMNLLEEAYDERSGYFVNYKTIERRFDDIKNMKEKPQDPTVRALYALEYTAINREVPHNLRLRAKILAEKCVNKRPPFDFPITKAFFIKALYYRYRRYRNKHDLQIMIENADWLIGSYRRFRKKTRYYKHDWEWFYHTITYANGVLPEALFFVYLATQDRKYLNVALSTAQFLMGINFKEGYYSPVGQRNWWKKGAKKSTFDQQPEEAAAFLEMLGTWKKVIRKQYRRGEIDIEEKADAEAFIKSKARETFEWFLGRNVIKQTVYDYKTGGCCDGVMKSRINLNQGAESMVAYLIARRVIEKILA